MTDAAAPLRKLVEEVYRKTVSGDLDWYFDQEADVCEVSIGQGYFQVCHAVDDDGDYYYYLKILNGQKQVIDTIYGGSLGTGIPSTGHENYWKLITDLRAFAHRRAIGSDAVIQSMLDSLGAQSDINLDDDVPF